MEEKTDGDKICIGLTKTFVLELLYQLVVGEKKKKERN